MGYDAELFEMTRHGFRIYFISFSDQWIQYLWISILYSIEQWNDFGCDLISSNIIIPDGGSSDTACILWSERNLECRYSGRALYTFMTAAFLSDSERYIIICENTLIRDKDIL